MSPSEKKRLLFINFTMGRLNEASDDIYEALADNDVEGLSAAMKAAKEVLDYLQESILDEGTQTEVKR